MAQVTTYSFEAKIASRGYHVYKNTAWVNAKEGDEVQVQIETNKDSAKVDPYACTIRVKGKYFDVTKTVGRIQREISRHVYFFIKKEEGWITGKVLSVKYGPSPIPSGCLEIPQLLTFTCSKSITFLKMKQFVNELYNYEFTGGVKIEEWL